MARSKRNYGGYDRRPQAGSRQRASINSILSPYTPRSGKPFPKFFDLFPETPGFLQSMQISLQYVAYHEVGQDGEHMTQKVLFDRRNVFGQRLIFEDFPFRNEGKSGQPNHRDRKIIFRRLESTEAKKSWANATQQFVFPILLDEGHYGWDDNRCDVTFQFPVQNEPYLRFGRVCEPEEFRPSIRRNDKFVFVPLNLPYQIKVEKDVPEAEMRRVTGYETEMCDIVESGRAMTVVKNPFEPLIVREVLDGVVQFYQISLIWEPAKGIVTCSVKSSGFDIPKYWQ